MKEVIKLKQLDKQLQTNDKILFTEGFDNESLINISNKVQIWIKSIDELVDWARFRKAYKKCADVGLENYVDDLIVKEFDPEKLVNQFKKKYFYKNL